MIGTGAAHIFAEIDQPDTNFILRLWDYAPNGKRQLITTGYLKASHRELDERTTEGNPYHPHTRSVPVEPGKIEEYVLRLYPFANTFKPGHRLMVELSNDEPLADEHNALLPPDAFHLPVGRPVTHKIYRDAAHQSRLVLPFTTRRRRSQGILALAAVALGLPVAEHWAGWVWAKACRHLPAKSRTGAKPGQMVCGASARLPASSSAAFSSKRRLLRAVSHGRPRGDVSGRAGPGPGPHCVAADASGNHCPADVQAVVEGCEAALAGDPAAHKPGMAWPSSVVTRSPVSTASPPSARVM